MTFQIPENAKIMEMTFPSPMIREKILLIEALKLLRKKAVEGHIHTAYGVVGICYIISVVYQQKTSFLDIFKNLGAASISYPIGAGRDEYHQAANLWRGEQLTKRLALIDDMIGYLESEDPSNYVPNDIWKK